ncbi:hypothetical protein OVA24_06895 [Luteolibacter sp. SL250]|uniref:hypothetical protein n=1 Tax=Luteolibacter sp. SL250 TaxID=2995170 RepID=UPI00226F2FF8|nr:hypothetical protein [Luteolibacter sp. SL250]WAC21109.1 hypothetical protein OVA24_06895 [Luteolibacter sp. SL250]
MAPNLAMEELSRYRDSIILDPMAGSGTVLKHASVAGNQAIGLDMDPLAVMMSQVFNTGYDLNEVAMILKKILNRINDFTDQEVELPWIDGDAETLKFIKFWFGPRQELEIRRIIKAINDIQLENQAQHLPSYFDLMRIALSRIIVTKENGASLARDVSHSRPHKVTHWSVYDVTAGFQKSLSNISKLLEQNGAHGLVKVSRGDARNMTTIENRSIDLVFTSPPYLNAIDYMRGHKLALVWLGYTCSELRKIRSSTIGAERGPESKEEVDTFEKICDEMLSGYVVDPRTQQMITRYAGDSYRLMSEISRTLKSDGKAVLVVGDSCLKGVFIKNSGCFIKAAEMVGMRLSKRAEREIPANRRYLPMPARDGSQLAARMRSEVVLTFEFPAI